MKLLGVLCSPVDCYLAFLMPHMLWTIFVNDAKLIVLPQSPQSKKSSFTPIWNNSQMCVCVCVCVCRHHHHHHYHHVPEGLGVFPVPWSSRWSWSLHLFLGRPMFLRPVGLYCSACFGSLFVSILCTCCSHIFWYYFISFTVFCAPLFCLIHWLFSLSSFVIPSKCLKNFISLLNTTTRPGLTDNDLGN